MPPRRGHTQSIEKRTDMAEKQRHALELRNAGRSLQFVADIYGVDQSTVSRWCSAAIKDIPREAAEEFRQRQLLQLDAMLEAIWDDVVSGNQLKIDRALAILERQAKLTGLEDLAKIEALKAAKGDAGVEAESMIGTLIDGLKAAYVKQKERATSDVDDLDGDDE
ncbi:MAG: hypothetical protein A2Y38_25865 [Spirochaetes bacterium GWB1_59_5]|nr:MAG: hypothetical protein A2Y38_25865 [Spirochaetes bacterium GWB1_59_5]